MRGQDGKAYGKAAVKIPIRTKSPWRTCCGVRAARIPPLEMYLLSEDMNAKIKACKTEEEMMKVLGEEGIALDDDLPDSPGGGYGDGTHRKKQHAYTALNREKTILFSGFLAYLV